MTTLALRAVASFVFIVFPMTTDAGGWGYDFLLHRSVVTAIAFDALMRTVELEPSAGVVIEVPDLPVAGIVTLPTCCSEPPPMRVVVLMTCRTVGGSLLLIQASSVATFAGRRSMLAEERVCGGTVMIKRKCLPALLYVALVTLLTKVRTVNVVFLMTGKTLRWRFLLIQLPLVAAVTFHLSMVSLQRIIRVAIMLEEQRLPVTFRMAGDTLLPEASLVWIVFFVATGTINRSLVLVEMPLVARFAFCPQVSSRQRVFGMEFVVKDDRFPIALCMTGPAFLPITSLMRVVLLMAGVTVCGSVLKRWCSVTLPAFDRFMLAQ